MGACLVSNEGLRSEPFDSAIEAQLVGDESAQPAPVHTKLADVAKDLASMSGVVISEVTAPRLDSSLWEADHPERAPEVNPFMLCQSLRQSEKCSEIFEPPRSSGLVEYDDQAWRFEPSPSPIPDDDETWGSFDDPARKLCGSVRSEESTTDMLLQEEPRKFRMVSVDSFHSVHSVVPYSEVYGMHPKYFDFDASGEKVLLSMSPRSWDEC